MRQVALDSMALVLPPLGYLWAPRAYGGQRVFTWTAVMAEHARQRILAWFEANYREGLTWQEVHELALELLKSYARKRASRGTA
jgi:20S proteasome alpha/beta subunit